MVVPSCVDMFFVESKNITIKRSNLSNFFISNLTIKRMFFKLLNYHHTGVRPSPKLLSITGPVVAASNGFPRTYLFINNP